MKRFFKDTISAWTAEKRKKDAEKKFWAEQRRLDEELGWLYIS